MKRKIKKFLKSEEGYTAESLTWTGILGIGAATVCFGLYAANRFLSGGIGDDVKAIATPSSIPVATEQVTSMQAGYTGAVTGLTIE